MVVYWGILIGVFVIGWCQSDDRNPLKSNNAKPYQATWGLAIALLAPVTFFAAVRGPINDTGTYVAVFDQMPDDFSLFDEWCQFHDSSLGFYGLTMLWRVFVSDDAQWWLALIAVVQGVLLAKAFRQYSPDIVMTVYIFIASTTFTWMYNGIRQFLVITILFAMTDCILKNKWQIYIPVVLLLAGAGPVLELFKMEVPWWLDGIHTSALLMIPVFFFVQGKAFNWKILLMTAVFCVLAVTGGLGPLLESTAEGTEYESDVAFFEEEGDDGAHPLRAVVAAAPLAMVFVKKKELDAMGDEVPAIVSVSINMTVFTVALYVASTLTSSGILVGRLPMYTELYGYVLIPWLIMNVYKRDQKLLSTCIYLAYLMWFVYQMYIAWAGLAYKSDVLNLSF